MSMLDFSETPKRGKAAPRRSLKLVLGIGVISGAFALSSTLAANINLNDGGNVEFGQGVAQTTACDESVLVTPVSTFVNNEEDPGFFFSSFTVSDVSNECNEMVFIIKAYKNGQNTPLNLYTTTGVIDPFDEVEVLNRQGSFSLIGAGLGEEAISDITGGFTVNLSTSGAPASTTVASAQDVDRITIESRDSTAAERLVVYSVGDTGPGGGKIFYVANAPFNCGPTLNLTCTYLEAAPTSGTNAWTDAKYVWSGNVNGRIGMSESDWWNIGVGYRNTLLMVGQSGGGNTADRAGTVARAYRGPNNLTDWYLPSVLELDKLYENRTSAVFTPIADYYWTSSDRITEDLRAHVWWFGNSVDWYARDKSTENYVRPIRAF